MNYLLDTHTLIWFLNGDKKISKTVQSLIENTNNKKFVSIGSLWEMAIKISLKKMEFDGTIPEIIDLIEQNSFELIPISTAHIAELERLPIVHRDPFDRMLVVQAMVEDLVILTRDENIPQYNIRTKW